MVFNWLKGKSKEPTRGELFAQSFDLDLPVLTGLLRRRLADEATAERAMLLVAFKNARSELKVLRRRKKEKGTDVPTTYAEFGRVTARLFDKYPPTRESELEIPSAAELKHRRLFHFYRASMLGAVSERGHETNQDMQAVADVWGEYIASSGHLASIAKHSRLWSEDELMWFAADFDDEAQIQNVVITVVPGFLWKHDEMLAMAKKKFGLNRSFLRPIHDDDEI